MTQRITLSIPDMLHEKMEKWRQSFNLSKMFQDALAEAITKKEEFQKRFFQESDISEIIERLRAEKIQSEGNYSENGRIEGLQWARSAHYDELIYAVGITCSDEILTDPRLGTYFTEILNSDVLYQTPCTQTELSSFVVAGAGLKTSAARGSYMEKTTQELNKYTKLFFEGWHKGVTEFWNEIKEKL
ncbi:MAG: hypothetical protein U9N77_06295 [Thermodesulfobacteriota bacterium]|nr:hypothetical protein [Thermodesulfobacteriota bacterium]